MDFSLTSFFVHFLVSPKMYNKVRKDIPQISSHIYILSLSASLLQTLMILLYYCLPSAERVNERGSNLEKGRTVQGRDRRYSGGTPEVTENLFSPTLPLWGRVREVGCVLLSPMILW